MALNDSFVWLAHSLNVRNSTLPLLRYVFRVVVASKLLSSPSCIFWLARTL